MNCISVTPTLMKISPTYRKRIKASYRKLGGAYVSLNPHYRAILAEAIWSVEDDLEYDINQRGGIIAEGASGGKQVLAMRKARNQLYDDLRWNESPNVKETA